MGGGAGLLPASGEGQLKDRLQLWPTRESIGKLAWRPTGVDAHGPGSRRAGLGRRSETPPAKGLEADDDLAWEPQLLGLDDDRGSHGAGRSDDDLDAQTIAEPGIGQLLGRRLRRRHLDWYRSVLGPGVGLFERGHAGRGLAQLAQPVAGEDLTRRAEAVQRRLAHRRVEVLDDHPRSGVVVVAALRRLGQRPVGDHRGEQLGVVLAAAEPVDQLVDQLVRSPPCLGPPAIVELLADLLEPRVPVPQCKYRGSRVVSLQRP